MASARNIGTRMPSMLVAAALVCAHGLPLNLPSQETDAPAIPPDTHALSSTTHGIEVPQPEESIPVKEPYFPEANATNPRDYCRCDGDYHACLQCCEGNPKYAFKGLCTAEASCTDCSGHCLMAWETCKQTEPFPCVSNPVAHCSREQIERKASIKPPRL